MSPERRSVYDHFSIVAPSRYHFATTYYHYSVDRRDFIPAHDRTVFG
jgi:hypothetical protein